MSIRGRQFSASIELLLAAIFWGFGFIAVVWALEVVSVIQITFLRFFLGGLVGTFFLFSNRLRANVRENFRLSFYPAIFICGALLFQTWGLLHTTATKSGFITTLYVVIVPLLDLLLRRQRIAKELWFCVATALLGTALIVNLGTEDLNFGDVLTLICAFLTAGQILVLGVVSPRVRAPFVFNIVQCWWSALICLPLLALDPFSAAQMDVSHWPITAVLGILSLAFGSTVIAFYLQVRAQAQLSPTVSSLFFLLESPFAMFFAILLLAESLSLLEAVGAALIFTSAIVASLFEAKRKKL